MRNEKEFPSRSVRGTRERLESAGGRRPNWFPAGPRNAKKSSIYKAIVSPWPG